MRAVTAVGAIGAPGGGSERQPRGLRVGEWMTAKEAAEYLRLPSAQALYQRAARGEMKPYRFGKRLVRFRRGDLDALMIPMAA